MKNSKVYDRPIKPFPEYVQKDITYKLHTLLLALLRPTITPSILQPNILNLSEEDWTLSFYPCGPTRRYGPALRHDSPAPGTATALQSPQNPLGPEFGSHREAAMPNRPVPHTNDNALRFARRPYDLLKGLGLSIYYPRPEHRECGDIDLWLDNCDKGNRLIEELGIKINYDSEKHAVFHYKGVMVENHSICLCRRTAGRSVP